MLRALWFMIRLGLLAAAVLWLVDNPGTVRIDWKGYDITIHTGLFAFALIGVILISIFVHSFVRGIRKLPGSYRRYRAEMDTRKGYRALTLGLTAVASGDKNTAATQARSAAKYLPVQEGLVLLLDAQVARMEGRDAQARAHFELLSKNRDTAFLGVRGLLQDALTRGDKTAALEAARKGLSLTPVQPWMLTMVYGLQTQLGLWSEALATLKQVQRKDLITEEQARADKAALLLAQAEDLCGEHSPQSANLPAAIRKAEDAWRAAPEFAPASILLAEYCLRAQKKRKASRVVMKAWGVTGHPHLLPLWLAAMPDKSPVDAAESFRRIRELIETSGSSSSEALCFAARFALDAALWGEARQLLGEALERDPGAGVYVLLAELEERSGQGDLRKASGWLQKAALARPDYKWMCGQTGIVYPRWRPLAQPHGSFNTIVWQRPDRLVLNKTEGEFTRSAALAGTLNAGV